MLYTYRIEGQMYRSVRIYPSNNRRGTGLEKCENFNIGPARQLRLVSHLHLSALEPRSGTTTDGQSSEIKVANPNPNYIDYL